MREVPPGCNFDNKMLTSLQRDRRCHCGKHLSHGANKLLQNISDPCLLDGGASHLTRMPKSQVRMYIHVEGVDVYKERESGEGHAEVAELG